MHAGSGLGFHGMYNLEAGITQFGHFRDRATGADLSSGSSNDFTFGFGGGLGYGFAPNMDMYVGQQGDIILHSQGDETDPEAPTGRGPTAVALRSQLLGPGIEAIVHRTPPFIRCPVQ